VSGADRGCEYDLTRQEYADLVGSARNWEEFLERKADGDGVWECPHDRADGKRQCVFHLDPLEVPDGVDEGAALIEAVERSDGAEGSGRYRYKQFIGATFGDLHLGGGTIAANDSEPLDFTGATFERDVSAAATIEQPVVLAHATTEQWTRTDLAGTVFEGTVNARGATFRDPLLCNDALFARGANFEGATFANAVNFDRTVFGNTAFFQSATFGGEALFREVTFRSRANFIQVVVHAGLDFERATFESVADFKQSAFGGRMRFPRVTFEDDAEFRESLFAGEAEFEDAVFERAAAFGRNLMHRPAEFQGPTAFERADLSGATFSDCDLVGATFDGADLTEATLTDCDLRLAGLETAILSRASLFDADLRGSALSGAVVTDARINDETRLLHPPTDDLPAIALVPKGLTAVARRLGAVSDDAATIPACGYDPAFRTPVAVDGGSSDDAGGLLSGRGFFSARAFLVLLVASVLGIVVGGSVPFVGGITRYVGLLVVAFAAGLVGSRRRYLEAGLAGALAAGLTFVVAALTSLLNPLGMGFLGQAGVAGAGRLGLTVAGIGVGTGLLVSLAGYYFGRDLRDGLTRDV